MNREKLEILTKKPFKWGDLVLILTLVLVFILPFALMRPSKGATVEIYKNRALAGVYELGADRDVSFENNGIRILVRIRGGKIFVAETDCPDKLCKNMGEISGEGEVILCIPGGLKVAVVGKESGVDGSTS